MSRRSHARPARDALAKPASCRLRYPEGSACTASGMPHTALQRGVSNPAGSTDGLTGGMPATFIAASMYGPKCSMSTYVFCRVPAGEAAERQALSTRCCRRC